MSREIQAHLTNPKSAVLQYTVNVFITAVHIRTSVQTHMGTSPDFQVVNIRKCEETMLLSHVQSNKDHWQIIQPRSAFNMSLHFTACIQANYLLVSWLVPRRQGEPLPYSQDPHTYPFNHLSHLQVYNWVLGFAIDPDPSMLSKANSKSLYLLILCSSVRNTYQTWISSRVLHPKSQQQYERHSRLQMCSKTKISILVTFYVPR